MTISQCRVCHSDRLDEILTLGDLGLTGVFPDKPNAKVSHGILTLVLCENCSLVQLDRDFDSALMYGDNYGYRSGLNLSMVEHLATIKNFALSLLPKYPEIVLDIGSNDGTLLRHWSHHPRLKIGIDPTAQRFREFYDEWSKPVTGFFEKDLFLNATDGRKADVVTSIAMFYDLPDPVAFARAVGDVLENDGIWVSEQSYMPWMIDSGAYDTICHEHVEYYSLKSLEEIMGRAGLRVIKVELTQANGGSIRLAAVRTDSTLQADLSVAELRNDEAKRNLNSLHAFTRFTKFTLTHGDKLYEFIKNLNLNGKRVIGLGASTKGSVVLQRSGLTSHEIIAIGDVNPFKFGKFTATSDIPIISEEDAFCLDADYALILPWHFRSTFEAKLPSRIKPIWPLPAIEFENHLKKWE